MDLDSQEIISGEARNSIGAMAGAPAFPANLRREYFREFLPEKAYHMTLTCGSHEQTRTLHRGLRIEDPGP
jgi:hypothetical protein